MINIEVQGFSNTGDSCAYVRVDFGDGQFSNYGGIMEWCGAAEEAIRIESLVQCNVEFTGHIPDSKPAHIWAFMQEKCGWIDYIETSYRDGTVKYEHLKGEGDEH